MLTLTVDKKYSNQQGLNRIDICQDKWSDKCTIRKNEQRIVAEWKKSLAHELKTEKSDFTEH